MLCLRGCQRHLKLCQAQGFTLKVIYAWQDDSRNFTDVQDYTQIKGNPEITVFSEAKWEKQYPLKQNKQEQL